MPFDHDSIFRVVFSLYVLLLLLHDWVWSREVLALWCEDQIELELSDGVLDWALVLLEVDDEIVLDGEHGVGLEPWVVLGVDLCDDGLVVWVGDLQMD